jgi:fructokinase
VRIGIDVGGTKIEGILLDGSAERARLRVPTPRGDYRGTIEAIADLVARLKADATDGMYTTVGVGIPGTLSPRTGLVKNANSTWLIGKPLRQDLEARLGQDVRLANDANCFAVSEAADGAAAGAEVVFGVIVGTGTGAGLVVRGRVVTGPNAIAGEWGHNPLPWAGDDERPGPPCYCGQAGCIETFLSGPAFERDFGPPADVGAGQVPDAYIDRMARALASVINVLDPDVIVLGGGMSNLDALYGAVPARWNRWIFGGEAATRLVRARHGDSSGVRGAAWLWPAVERRAGA